MDNIYTFHSEELPADIDWLRLNDREQYLFRLEEMTNWRLIYIIKGANLYDKKYCDKGKPKKWFLLGSYFYYKVINHSEFADNEHLILGTYCFLLSLMCRKTEHEYYNSDLSIISAARLIQFWYLFGKEPLKEEFIKVSKILYPNSTSENNSRYISAKMQLINGLAYIFKSHFNGILKYYKDYINEDEKEFMDLGFQHINILFDPSYKARAEIIEHQSKYLETLWKIIQTQATQYLN